MNKFVNVSTSIKETKKIPHLSILSILIVLFKNIYY